MSRTRAPAGISTLGIDSIGRLAPLFDPYFLFRPARDFGLLRAPPAAHRVLTTRTAVRRPLSAKRHSLHLFWVPVALHRHRGGCVGDLAKFVRCKFQRSCADVLFHARQFRGAGDRNDPGFLCEKPGECYLSASRVLPRCKRRNDIHQSQPVIGRQRHVLVAGQTYCPA